jgi:hypothetical protein
MDLAKRSTCIPRHRRAGGLVEASTNCEVGSLRGGYFTRDQLAGHPTVDIQDLSGKTCPPLCLSQRLVSGRKMLQVEVVRMRALKSKICEVVLAKCGV